MQSLIYNHKYYKIPLEYIKIYALGLHFGKSKIICWSRYYKVLQKQIYKSNELTGRERGLAAIIHLPKVGNLVVNVAIQRRNSASILITIPRGPGLGSFGISWHPFKVHNFRKELLGHSSTVMMHEILN